MTIKNKSMLLIVGTLVGISFSSAEAARKVHVKVYADSEHVGYEAHRAMDGDPDTIWHSDYSVGAPVHPHFIEFDLGRSREVTGFSYLPRTGCPNGTIKDYALHISDDYDDFGKSVIAGAFQHGNKKNVVQFNRPVTGRYIKLIALSEVNGRPWASIAEIQFFIDGIECTTDRARGWFFNRKPMTEMEQEYEGLRNDIRRRRHIYSHADQVYNSQSLILDTDRDPLDIVLRRSTALLEYLAGTSSPSLFLSLAARLDALKQEASSVAVGSRRARYALFEKACKLRREIVFANPLLDFENLLFIKRHRATFNHMCDQYYGINVVPGGGLFVLENAFSDNPKAYNVLADSVVKKGRLSGEKLDTGSFVSPDLSYNGASVVFAYVECEGDTEHRHHTDPTRGHWHQQRCYHLFRVNVDGTQLEQLTDGTWNDFDPCWLPNGRVAFISERRGGYLRCGRVCPNYTLHDINADGTDIRCLSPHETNEWHPSVTNDGMIIYTRWDYVDRHGCTAHLPWITTPDGRDSRAVHGNFAPRELRVDMELDVRAIPGSHKYIATGAPHHGQAFGSLISIDPNVEDDDAMSPVKRITPEVDFPETQGGGQVYGTPWPLSENFYLCVYDSNMQPGVGGQGQKHVRGDYGIYIVDAFGNRELLYRDPEIACQSPIPLRPRTKPPVVPDESIRVPENELAEGTFALMNVYDTLNPWPEEMQVKSLRVFQILPMTVPSGAPPHETSLREPTARDSVVLARYVLGTVPVEKDGSAYFKAPARKELFFQALDEKGLAIQSMRSATYLQPGEQLVCQGCHEPRHRSPQLQEKVPLALRRQPSSLKPDVDGTNPFSYPRLVQPVLDKHCVSCHAEHPKEAPRLDSEVIVKDRQKWYTSYHNLAPEFGFWDYGDRMRTRPGEFGARASKLYKMLQEGHHDVELSEEEMHRITVWLDACSIFYGVYEEEGGIAQLAGKIVSPTLE